MQARLGITTASMTSPELISAILRAPVDLLWNGGIGTYVKATTESHAEVGDKANDGLRVNATQLQCKVVAEGGNLGFTQRARVEYALGGGRINTDAIDNSAGVDTSDHEVNIKILLDGVVRAGRLSLDARNALLDEMTDEVAALVLADNVQQNQTLTIARFQALQMAGVHERLMVALEARGRLDRALEFLPDHEMLALRVKAGGGLTVPELAVLLAYSKITLEEDLRDSALLDDPDIESEIEVYFPTLLRERYTRGDGAPSAAPRAHRHRARQPHGQPGRQHVRISHCRGDRRARRRHRAGTRRGRKHLRRATRCAPTSMPSTGSSTSTRSAVCTWSSASSSSDRVAGSCATDLDRYRSRRRLPSSSRGLSSVPPRCRDSCVAASATGARRSAPT